MKSEIHLLGMQFNMATRTSRRKLVIVIYAVLSASATASWMIDRWRVSVALVFLTTWLANRFVLGGYGPESRAMIKPFLGNDVRSRYLRDPDSRWSRLARLTIPDVTDPKLFCNDERELQRRDEVHWIAYRCLGVTALLAFLVAYLKSLAARLPSWSGIAGFADAVIYGLLLTAFVLFVTLPQVIILWTEPDLEVELPSPTPAAGAAR